MIRHTIINFHKIPYGTHRDIRSIQLFLFSNDNFRFLDATIPYLITSLLPKNSIYFDLDLIIAFLQQNLMYSALSTISSIVLE